MTLADDSALRAARQDVRTSELLGVDFVPVGQAPVVVEVASAEAEVATADRPGAAVEVKTPGVPHSIPDFEPLTQDQVRALDGPAARQAALDQLRIVHDGSCPHCSVVTGHTQPVFGEGNPDAGLMFIGEAPGAEEDRTGRPFVGRAGKKLDEIIRAMGLEREQVYIANVLKARPPDNRTPQPDEVARCGPFLMEQVRIIQPSVIVTLGGPATKLILDTNVGITKLRGIWGVYRAGEREVPVMPTFHPAYLLRNYTKDTRQKVWSDMQAVLDRMKESG